MADKSQQLVVEALQRGAAEPGGLPILASKSASGLFPASAAGKQAAQLCQQQGLVHAVRKETRGKATLEIWALSEKGLTFLLEQVSPRRVMEGFAHALEKRREELENLVASARASQHSLAELGNVVRKALESMHEPKARPGESNGHAGTHEDKTAKALIDHLRFWQDAGNLGDCPLPELYRLVRKTQAALTMGQFQDGLRGLHRDQRIYLHPWTGPLYEIPEPAAALLVGHEIAYYASLRT